MALAADRSSLTILELTRFLLACDGIPHVPSWPPDVFAVAACLLHRSGAYLQVVRSWPPGDNADGWVNEIKRIGKAWRQRWIDERQAPGEVEAWWQTAIFSEDAPLTDLLEDPDRCDALLQLCAAADEACDGVGIPGGSKHELHTDPFERHASTRLRTIAGLGSSLCESIDHSRIRVLPKMHTPQSGLTIRSLSHNIAAIQTADIEPVWTKVTTNCAKGNRANLLLVPWPEVVRPADFVQVDPHKLSGELRNMPSRYGFFEYVPKTAADPAAVCSRISKLVTRAEDWVGRIDGVVLPELALTTEQHTALQSQLVSERRLLISGIRGDAAGTPTNQVGLSVPLSDPLLSFTDLQSKHHRWCLDKNQIIQYGLGGSLDPGVLSWEHIQVMQRRLHFVAMQSWLTISVLLCEDLARQDPVADIVRAVGPNLVIALLMDGPQLPERWPARYATVLADDPGSSVLTLTSIGMASMSRPPGIVASSRVVGLWKDVRSGVARQLVLPPGSDAIAISLAVEYVEEFTADARGDEGATGYPILVGVHPVSIDSPWNDNCLPIDQAQ